jgi:hypothetical protein
MPAVRSSGSTADSAGTATMPRPLSALVSQVLVAFTVELDNEFERQIAAAGHPGARLSLMVWLNLLRFVPDDGRPVGDLVAESLLEPSQIKLMLGCLERWGFVTLQPGTSSKDAGTLIGRTQSGRLLRDGFGSGRGITSTSIVRATLARGVAAKTIWPPLPALIEERWRARFGTDEIEDLRRGLQACVDRSTVELPRGFIDVRERARPFPQRQGLPPRDLSLPVLLSQILLAFALDFERESPAPLALCANAIRVMGDAGIPEGDIPRLTGSSPETSGIGWQLKPYIIVGRDPAKARGKLVRLSPLGLDARRRYDRLTAAIETRWREALGAATVSNLRGALEGILGAEHGDHPLMSEGLVPPRGTIRSGDVAPALGRRDVGVAARKRARDLVVQSEQFARDPASTLPHYPLWDMNRGFGP